MTQVTVFEFFESCREGDLKRFWLCFFTAGLGLAPGAGGTKTGRKPRSAYILKGLILAQNERWRRGLGMQVERIPGG